LATKIFVKQDLYFQNNRKRRSDSRDCFNQKKSFLL